MLRTTMACRRLKGKFALRQAQCERFLNNPNAFTKVESRIGMLHLRRHRFQFWIAAWFLISAALGAEEIGRGGYAGAFLRMGLGARGMAMGGGSVALGGGGCTAHYNPAILVFLDGTYVTASLNAMALDRSLRFIGYAQSVGGKKADSSRGLIRGGFSLGWLSAGVDGIDGRDDDGIHTQTYSNSEHCFTFSFALNPDPRIAFGFSGKVLYNRFPKITDNGGSVSATGFGFDIGLIVKPVPSVSLGLVLRDIRSKYTWDSQKLFERGTQTVNPFPRVLRAGASWKGWKDRLVLSCDLEKVEFFPKTFSFGAEAEPVRGVFVRGGMLRNEKTFGAGTRFLKWGKTVVLDYAYVPDPVAPSDVHVFTWSIVF